MTLLPPPRRGLQVGIVHMFPDGQPSTAAACCLIELGCRVEEHVWCEPRLYEYIRDSPIRKWFFTGSPALVTNAEHPDVDARLYTLPNKSFFMVCYSHQLLCRALGCRVSTLRTPIRGAWKQVRPVRPDPLWDGAGASARLPGIPWTWLWCSQAVALREAPRLARHDWAVLAVRGDYIMAMRKGPHYSVQFHPEHHPVTYHMVATWLRHE